MTGGVQGLAGDVPAKPYTSICVQPPELAFRGDFTLPLTIAGKTCAAVLLVIANEVDLAQAKFFVNNGSQA